MMQSWLPTLLIVLLSFTTSIFSQKDVIKEPISKTTSTTTKNPCVTTTSTTTTKEKTPTANETTPTKTTTTEKATTRTTTTTKENPTTTTTTTTEKPTTTTSTTTTTTTTTTKPPPSLNITGSSCLIKGIYIYLDFDLTVVRGDPKDISMCYTSYEVTKCNTFPICEKRISGNDVSITCQTFAKWDTHVFKIYLENEGIDKVLAYDEYTPLFEKNECKFREEDILSVKQVNATENSVTVFANVTKPTYADIEDARLAIIDSKKKIKVDCVTDSSTTAYCNVTGLGKCEEYKACVSVKTVFFGRSQKCIEVYTDSPVVEKPRNLLYVVLSEYIPFKSTVFNWDGPKLNTSADYYQYSYVYKYKRYVMKTTTSHISVECDLNSNFTVKLCTRCGCSEELWVIIKRGIHFGNWNVVSSLKNQVDYWRKKNNERMNIWTGVVGGIGGGFFIAIVAMLVYKRRKNNERRPLLRDAQSVKYSNFSCNIDDNTTDIQ